MVKLEPGKIYGVLSDNLLAFKFFEERKNSKTLIFKNLSTSLDYQELKEFKRKGFKEKIVIIFDSDINLLYELCDFFFLFEDEIVFGTREELFETKKIENLSNKPVIPYIVYLARKKGVFLQYNNNETDLVKDIYKWLKKN